MNRKQDTAYGIKRIESKNARAASEDRSRLQPDAHNGRSLLQTQLLAEHADVKLTSGRLLLDHSVQCESRSLLLALFTHQLGEFLTNNSAQCCSSGHRQTNH